MTAAGHPLFACHDIRVEVPARVLVDALSCEVRPGELLAILGQNGSGKTLTLHTLAGLRPACRGRSVVLGHDVASTDRREIARHLALMPQHVEDIFPTTVLETAMIGRHPHIGRFGWQSTTDSAIATAALAAVGLRDMAARDVLTLSGGERRRLAIAQVLTQEPQLYLLDEPTNHLDPQHQLEALQLFRNRADAGAAVIASLHDVNLAVRYADRCLLLFGDGRWELGATRDVLSERRLSALFATPMEGLDWRSMRLFVASGDVAP